METPLIDEFIDRRLYPCRACYGNGDRLMTPGEYADAAYHHKLKRAKKRAAGKDDIGDFPEPASFYDHRKAPDPDCPDCQGQGIQKTLIKDTRTLSPRAKAAFAGVRRVDGHAVVMYRENGTLHEVAAT